MTTTTDAEVNGTTIDRMADELPGGDNTNTYRLELIRRLIGTMPTTAEGTNWETDDLGMLSALNTIIEHAELLRGELVGELRRPQAKHTGYGWRPGANGGQTSDRYGWDEIGEALGISKSTAQSRYKRFAPTERSRY